MRIGAALVLLGLALLTAFRVPAWKSDQALWTAAVATSPQSPRSALNLAAALSSTGNYRSACMWLDQARTLATRRHDRIANTIAAQHTLWIAIVATPCGS